MLNLIEIKGLFNHLDSSIPISNNLTVITGSNDSGKSSIFHAVRWFVTNKPRDGKLLLKTNRQHVDHGSIKMVVDNQSVVKSRDSYGKTTYLINEEDQFFKSELPDEVRSILKFKSDYTFSDLHYELNFAFQLDAPFLLSESPSIGALMLGQLAGTSPVDRAAKYYDSKANQYRSKLKEQQSRKEEYEERLKNYDGIEDKLCVVNTNLNKLEYTIDLDRKIRDLEKIYSNYELVANRITEKIATLNYADKIIKCKDNIDKIYEYAKLKSRIIVLSHNFHKLIGFNKSLFKRVALLKKFITFFSKVNRLCSLLSKLSDLKILSQQFVKNKAQITQLYIKLEKDNLVSLDKYFSIVTILRELCKQLLILSNLYYRCGYNEEEIKHNKFVRDNQPDINNCKILLSKLNRINNNKFIVNKIMLKYFKVFYSIDTLKLLVKKHTKNLEQLMLEKKDMLNRLEICPTCGTILKEL